MSGLLPDQLQQTCNGTDQLVEFDAEPEVFDITDICRTVDDEIKSLGRASDIRFPLSRVYATALERCRGCAPPSAQPGQSSGAKR